MVEPEFGLRGGSISVLRLFLVLIICLGAIPGFAQQDSREDQQRTCEAVLGDHPAARECTTAFAKDAGCCIQYNEKALAKRCATMSTVEFALACFSEIHEVGFWKTDLTGENEPGLAATFADQWKKNVLKVCSAETTNSDAIACAILQKSGTKFGYRERNAELANQATKADPIFQFCREAFGDYWEGVEECVQKQRAAKKRLGQ